MTRVVHLTSSHALSDPRILFRECVSLAEAGFEVALVGPGRQDHQVQGVEILAVPPSTNRLHRATVGQLRVLLRGLWAGGEVYHFHEPELIPTGLLLRLCGRRVIYDIHEDYHASLLTKPYLPLWVRRLTAWVYCRVEERLSSVFSLVLADRCWQARVPAGVVILNLPRLELFGVQKPGRDQTPRFLYAGCNGIPRGAARHANVVNLVPESEVHLVGRFAPGVHQLVQRIAGARTGRLVCRGREGWVPYPEVVEHINRHHWTAGLALVSKDSYYGERLLSKFFEYMAVGIPVVCTDFPLWREVIEVAGAGLCVDPDRPEQVAEALRFLLEHPDEARAMGERGRRLVEERYNWRREQTRLLDLYAGSVQTRSPGGSSR